MTRAWPTTAWILAFAAGGVAGWAGIVLHQRWKRRRDGVGGREGPDEP